MTAQTFTALFDTYAAASNAVSQLEAAGIPHDRISIVSNDPSHAEHTSGTAHTGTGTGASLGTLLGGGAGLLAGLGLLAIPGLGPVVAAGWLASTLVGAGVGAAAGGIVGALTDAGVSHEDAQAYAEGIHRGGTLVTVRGDTTEATQITSILDRDGTVDLDQRTQDWRGSGWTGTYGGGSATGTASDRPLGTGTDPTLAPAPATGAPVTGAPITGTAAADGVGRPRVRAYDTTI
jgi:hypothetical protein